MKRIFGIVVLLFVVVGLQAQTRYHDLELNQVKGPVKSISVKHMQKRLLVYFTPDGKVQGDMYNDPVYDTSGYMLSVHADKKGKTAVTYQWENGILKSQTVIKKGKKTIISYVYDNKGNVITEMIDHNGYQMKNDFYDYEFDNHGNWIARKTKYMGIETKAERTIEYY